MRERRREGVRLCVGEGERERERGGGQRKKEWREEREWEDFRPFFC